MRLITAQTLLGEGRIAFREFYNEDVPPYAILSHTWAEGQEVSYSEACNLEYARWKTGYTKIVETCKQARSNNIDFVWIDTCCIDKSSSAELSEAINSMFRWYQNAVFCYVYLEDVIEPGQMNSHTRWFTRGWTLQELIAPRNPENMVFFNMLWNPIGTKLHLCDKLLHITKIDIDILLHKTALSSFASEGVSPGQPNVPRKELRMKPIACWGYWALTCKSTMGNNMGHFAVFNKRS